MDDPPLTVNSLRTPPYSKSDDWFVMGPIPGWLVCSAGLLPGHALHVALAVWHGTHVKKTRSVKLTNDLLIRFGVTSRSTARRALATLERAGLVEVKRRANRCPVVNLESID
jgi:hypothetical protein